VATHRSAHYFFISLHFSVLYLYMEYILQRGYCGHQSGFIFISLIENMQPGDTDIHYWWPPIGEGLIISLAFFKQHYPTSWNLLVKGVISLQAIRLNGFHATPPFYHLPGITILWLYGLILQVLLQQTIRSIVAMPQKDRIY
jgi:hypothetical protein